MTGFTLQPIRCPMATSLTVFGRSFHRPSPVDSMCSQSPMPGFTLQHVVSGRFVIGTPSMSRARWRDSLLHSGAASHANNPLCSVSIHALSPFTAQLRSATPVLSAECSRAKTLILSDLREQFHLSSHLQDSHSTGLVIHFGPLAWHPGCLDQEKV